MAEKTGLTVEQFKKLPDETQVIKELRLTLRADHSYEMGNEGHFLAGSWKVDGDTITLTPAKLILAGEPASDRVFKALAGTLTMHLENGRIINGRPGARWIYSRVSE